MEKPQLLSDDASFRALGISPDKIESWEDGARLGKTQNPGAFEWWYMDVHSKNGFVIVGTFHYLIDDSGKIAPYLNINFTKDAQILCNIRVNHYTDPYHLDPKKADAHIGKSFFTSLDGLDKYHIYIDPTENEGFGMDITIDRQAPSYRPGSGISGFVKNGPLFGWLCAIPEGLAEGTVMYNGETAPIKGSGYHDHNWGNCPLNELVDNWIWSRGVVDGISVVSSFTRFIPELGGGESCFLYMMKDNKLILNAVGENVFGLEGVLVNHSKTNKPTPTRCSFTYNDDKQKIVASFDRISDIATFQYDSASTEWACWYTRYNASLDVVINDKTNNTFKEMEGGGTLEVMDFKGEWIGTPKK